MNYEEKLRECMKREFSTSKERELITRPIYPCFFGKACSYMVRLFEGDHVPNEDLKKYSKLPKGTIMHRLKGLCDDEARIALIEFGIRGLNYSNFSKLTDDVFLRSWKVEVRENYG